MVGKIDAVFRVVLYEGWVRWAGLVFAVREETLGEQVAVRIFVACVGVKSTADIAEARG